MIDLRTVNDYKNNGDMLGLANYLSRYHFRDRFNQERVNATIKNLEYDFDFEKEEYEKETNEKAMKKAERLAAKEKKVKETAETKERKMKEKEKRA